MVVEHLGHDEIRVLLPDVVEHASLDLLYTVRLVECEEVSDRGPVITRHEQDTWGRKTRAVFDYSEMRIHYQPPKLKTQPNLPEF